MFTFADFGKLLMESYFTVDLQIIRISSRIFLPTDRKTRISYTLMIIILIIIIIIINIL